jgi:hypothetical protein
VFLAQLFCKIQNTCSGGKCFSDGIAASNIPQRNNIGIFEIKTNKVSERHEEESVGYQLREQPN